MVHRGSPDWEQVRYEHNRDPTPFSSPGYAQTMIHSRSHGCLCCAHPLPSALPVEVGVACFYGEGEGEETEEARIAYPSVQILPPTVVH